MNETTRAAPFRAHVTVDVTFVMEQFHPIMTFMEAVISNADPAAYRVFEKEGMYQRLFEAADHYLAFELGRKQLGNIGFDFYVSEYFGQYAKHLTANTDFLRTGGIYFANACGYLVRCLDLARQRAEELGAVVTEVESTSHDGWRIFSYTVTASFANHLYDFVQTPSVNY